MNWISFRQPSDAVSQSRMASNLPRPQAGPATSADGFDRSLSSTGTASSPLSSPVPTFTASFIDGPTSVSRPSRAAHRNQFDTSSLPMPRRDVSSSVWRGAQLANRFAVSLSPSVPMAELAFVDRDHREGVGPGSTRRVAQRSRGTSSAYPAVGTRLRERDQLQHVSPDFKALPRLVEASPKAAAGWCRHPW